MIPPIFTPLPVRLARLHEFGAMGQYGFGHLLVQAQQVPQHVLVIVYIIVHRDNNGIRKISQGGNQLPVGTDIALIVPYLEDGMAVGQSQKLLRKSLFAKLGKGQVEHHLVGQHRTFQDGSDSLHGIGYCRWKRGHGYDDCLFMYIRFHVHYKRQYAAKVSNKNGFYPHRTGISFNLGKALPRSLRNTA